MFWTSTNGPVEVPEALPELVDRAEQVLASFSPGLRRRAVSSAAGVDIAATFPFSPNGLEQASQVFVPGLAGRMTVGWESLDNDGRLVALDLSLDSSFKDQRVWNGRLACPPSLLGPGGTDEVANKLPGLLGFCAVQAGAVWGCASLDHWPGNMGQPPTEHYSAVSTDVGELQAAMHPRGYYWANLLTTSHLSSLGGLPRVRERAAQAGIEIRAVPGLEESEGLLLLGADRVSGFTDERLIAVKDLLDPVLLSKPYRWYAGPPLRVVKEPGTAFREIPADLNPMLPVFDDDEPLPVGDDW
ncbi:hypothetical protein ACFW1A_22545 [Kitasatospora sp. NPDC058965]|uniref:hypothetical protein n=1 Tax=Kitasatospora sp. NPDC058965 TaxID=3346682 RepID=UPI00368325A7